MGWQDRSNNSQINYGGNPFSHPLSRLFFGSVYVGTLFRTRIRIHATLLWYFGLSVALAGGDWREALLGAVMLFGLVFLHEFGHIFACRSVGGDADEMLLWMLGGLALTGYPSRPWAKFVTIVCGPLVNVVIGTALTFVIYFGYHVVPPLNPLFTFDSTIFHSYLKAHPEFGNLYFSASGFYVFRLYFVNWSLLFFNLIPMYPLDGGQMMQAILWKPLGYVQSMKIACFTGITLALLMVPLVLVTGAFFLLIVAWFSFSISRQTLRMLKFTGEQEEREPYDLSAAWENPDRPVPRKRRKKKWFRAARKLASREQAEQAKIDSILAKVKDRGLHSLTWWEKRALKKATERQRQQDLAERF